MHDGDDDGDNDDDGDDDDDDDVGDDNGDADDEHFQPSTRLGQLRANVLTTGRQEEQKNTATGQAKEFLCKGPCGKTMKRQQFGTTVEKLRQELCKDCVRTCCITCEKPVKKVLKNNTIQYCDDSCCWPSCDGDGCRNARPPTDNYKYNNMRQWFCACCRKKKL